jgi:hypothetical protein
LLARYVGSRLTRGRTEVVGPIVNRRVVVAALKRGQRYLDREIELDE